MAYHQIVGLSWRIALVVIASCSYTSPLVGGEITDASVDSAIDAQVVCSPGVVECNGRFIETCNVAGNGYDPNVRVTCPLVCEPGAPPTCLAASNIDESAQRACDSTAPPLAPVDGVVLVGAAGITCSGTNGCGTTTTIAPVATGGLLGFCVSRIEIPAAITVTFDPTLAMPVALFVDGAAIVDGTIDANGAPATASVSGASGGPGGGPGGGGGVRPNPGGAGGGACSGNGGVSSSGSGGTSNNGGGGAGGGFRGRGGPGGGGRTGDGINVAGGAAASTSSCGMPALLPLLGGAGGGGGGDGTGISNGPGGGGGGGAVQISSRVSISIAGAIRANGGGGFGSTADSQGNAGGSGGGAGGAILLEALVVATTGAVEIAGGAGGAANAGSGGAPGQGGDGGAGQVANTNGQGGAGGGGSAGRARINGNGVTCTNVSPSQACSTGTLLPTS